MALSQDLRVRVMRVYAGKEGSMRSLAQRFQVGWMTIWRWVTQYRLTGESQPKPQGKGRQPRVTGEIGFQFQSMLQTHSDATLEE